MIDRTLSIRYWLLKSEPSVFSIDDLERVGTEPWNGVRNYQARNYLRDDMRQRDRVFFYHSNCTQPGIVGLAHVRGSAYPDPSQFDPQSSVFDPKATPAQPRWWMVDVAFERKLAHPISLATIKQHSALLGGDFALTAPGNRLSVLPVSAQQWDYILSLEAVSGLASPTEAV